MKYKSRNAIGNGVRGRGVTGTLRMVWRRRMRRSVKHAASERSVDPSGALGARKSHFIFSGSSPRAAAVPVFSPGYGAGHSLRVRRDAFSYRVLEVFLRIHLPGTPSSPLSGLLFGPLRRALLPLRSDHETS